MLQVCVGMINAWINATFQDLNAVRHAKFGLVITTAPRQSHALLRKASYNPFDWAMDYFGSDQDW